MKDDELVNKELVDKELIKLVEAVLFVSDKPLTVKAIWQRLFGDSAETVVPLNSANQETNSADQESVEEAVEDLDTVNKDLDTGNKKFNKKLDGEPDEELDQKPFAEPLVAEPVSKEAVARAIETLQVFYQDRGIQLQQVASGYRFQAAVDLAPMIRKMRPEKPPRYSRAVLETLAIIGYQQPVTRAEIEDIRGVSVSSSIIKMLQERQWVRVVGHKDVPGKPALLATTKTFLDYFNLSSLDALPALAELKEMDFAESDVSDIKVDTKADVAEDSIVVESSQVVENSKLEESSESVV